MPHTPLLLRDVVLHDGTSAAPRPHTDVLVEHGRITAVAPAGTLPAARTACADVPDVAGHYLLPGFMDCHVHATTRPDARGIEHVTDPESLRTLAAVPHLAATLAAGVTTARDLAGADSGVREAIALGWLVGPRLLVAIRMLSVTGGHGDWRTVDGLPLDAGPGAGAIADSPAGFVRAVREVVRQGADWVKVAATGGTTSPTSSPDGGGLAPAELEAVVTEASRHGIPVAAHAQGAAGVRAAVEAGVRSVEHGYGIDDATVDLMGERGTFLVPTLSTLLRELPEGTPPAVLDARHRRRDAAVARLAHAFSQGVRVALGTDAGIAPHGTALTELGHLVDLGLTPSAAIAAGTSVSADLLGLDDLGRVREGARADLVVTDVDPVSNIHALADPRRIVLVVQDGVVRAGSPPDPGAAAEKDAT